MSDGSGFSDFLMKRASKRSTVGVVETMDAVRKVEYQSKFEDILIDNNKKSKPLSMELYTVDLMHGLRQIDVKGDTPYVKLIQGQGQDIVSTSMTPLSASLPRLGELLKRPNVRTMAVVSGLIDDQQTMNILEIFINDIAVDGDMCSNGSFVCVLVDDAGILPKSVSSNSFIIRPKPSTKTERNRLLDEVVSYANTKGKKKDKAALFDKNPDMYIDVTDGLNMNDFQSALMESLIRNDYNKIRFEEVIQLKVEIVNRLKGVRIDSLDDCIGFDAVGGYPEIKDWLNRKIVKVYDNNELAKKMNIHIPRGVLMFGPPGTGKTHLARQLAKGLDSVFIEIMFENLQSKYVGESEANLNELLARIDAMGSKVVVLFDEIDSLGRRGGDDMNKVHNNMFSRFLKWLSDPKRKAIIFGLTNAPQRLDSALIRPQRFDKIIYMGMPDAEARKEIFQIKFKDTKCKLAKDVDIDDLVRRTEWYSGADIEGIVNEAQTAAFERILNNDGSNEYITRADVERAINVKKKSDKAIASIKEMDKAYMDYADEKCDDKSLIMSVAMVQKRAGRLTPEVE